MNICKCAWTFANTCEHLQSCANICHLRRLPSYVSSSPIFALVSVDISPSFYMVNQRTLPNRLETKFGVHGRRFIGSAPTWKAVATLFASIHLRRRRRSWPWAFHKIPPGPDSLHGLCYADWTSDRNIWDRLPQARWWHAAIWTTWQNVRCRCNTDSDETTFRSFSYVWYPISLYTATSQWSRRTIIGICCRLQHCQIRPSEDWRCNNRQHDGIRQPGKWGCKGM